MTYKLLKLVTGEFVISKIFEEKNKMITLENPMIVDITYNGDNKPTFRYLPWQIITETRLVDINTASVVYSTAPKSELLTIYLNICTQFDLAAKAPSPRSVESNLMMS